MDIIQLLIVFGLSIIELWAAIPAGFALNLNPIVIIVAAAAGSILGALIVIVAGEKIRNKILKWRYGEKKGHKQGNLYRIWSKYGVVGLGLLSPLLFGALIGAALGSVLGAEKWRLLLWMSVGIVVWSIVLTFVSAAGLIGLNSFI
jgi:membrane protein YqaA with SNARE-associated domain